MKLIVYKGFDEKFLSKLTALPLYDNGLVNKVNILSYDKNLKKRISTALLSMEDEDVRWVTYEEYTFIKDNVDLAVRDYELEVSISVNNLYPDYYPINLKIDNDLRSEIIQTTQSDNSDSTSALCDRFLKIYSSACIVNNNTYCSYYNFEYETNNHIECKEYYPRSLNPTETTEEAEFSLLINDDVESYLKDLEMICAKKPRTINYQTTKGSVSARILNSLIAYCQYNGIELHHYCESIHSSDTNDSELIDIATNVIGIPNFTGFRKIKFYKNPDLSNEIVEISQSQIIRDIIAQAENAYSVEGGSAYRDIFITASTGAGKSVMFQIPAVYLAQKYNKLTIIIEPVKALMQDQKDQLNKRGYNRVEVFNSDLITQTEKEAVLKRVKSGEVDLLYLSPETLLSYSIETLIGDREIGLLIIDEAHIVTTWGVGFRPDYWYLGGYINYVRNGIKSGKQYRLKPQSFPICAFTATAVNGGIDDSVSETVISLYMENPIKYIGYAKRDNIAFQINKQELRRLPNSTYEQRKGDLFGQRVNDFVDHEQKTIVYFPYASYAYDAFSGVKSFAGTSLNKQKVGLYTGSNRENKSVEIFNSEKKEAFDKFRLGENTVMLATKAFGMGVDVDDIQNVYHYAVTGNLSDYVQEIGRAARKTSMQGYAITDYFHNDLNFMKSLFGMSQIRQYQINMVLAGIYNAFKSKKESLSFLISPESFTYIFGNAHDEDTAINRLKTCLLMLEKDLYDKYNFKVLISRPRGVFTKAFVVIQQEYKDKVLASKYGRYLEFIAPGRDHEKRSHGAEYSDCGDVYRIDLKSIWEEFNPNISFPQFKYLYFNRGTDDKGEKQIMPEISEYIFPRQRVSIETKHDVILCDIRGKILQDFEYIADVLSTQFKRKYFSQKEFTNAISKKYGQTKAKIITNALFSLVDPDSRCIKHRNNLETGEREYYVSNGTFNEYMRKHITGSVLLRSFANNHNVEYSQYIHFESDNSDAIALKLLSIFDYITYEIVGGEEPEIFIRLNDPEKIRRIISGEIQYSNNYVTKARQKHDRDVKILTKFFVDLESDEERWRYIERYFLGDDLLENVTNDKEKEVGLSILIDRGKSYPTDQFETWLSMSHLFDDDLQLLIEEFSSAKLPMPDYLETKLKGNLLSTDILMSWSDKNLLIFSEDISDAEIAICRAKGWKYYVAHDINIEALRMDLI